MAMTEAKACGTPVIAWPDGSVPKAVADSETASSPSRSRRRPWPSMGWVRWNRGQCPSSTGWLLVSVGVLAVVTLVAVLAALAVRRARRRAPRLAASLSR
jgi:hypothetical protein